MTSTLDAVISLLNDDDTLGTARAIAAALPERDNLTLGEVNAAIATYRAPVVTRSYTSDERCLHQVQHIIANIAEDSFTTLTEHGKRKPTYWLHKPVVLHGTISVADRKGIIASGLPGDVVFARWLTELLLRKLADGARVDQQVPF